MEIWSHPIVKKENRLQQSRKLRAHQFNKLCWKSHGAFYQQKTDTVPGILERNNIIYQEQSGFISNRRTENHVTNIAQKIENGFQEKEKNIAVWIDMKKSFDKVIQTKAKEKWNNQQYDCIHG